MEEIRLNKYLSDAGVCSRRCADRMVQEGRILVDGRTAQMGMKVHPGQRIVCDGKELDPVGTETARPVLLAVNKPRGIVCTTTANDRAVNIVEMVGYPLRVYPVGRLDKESRGLILMTNQGELVNRILRGSGGHEKEYQVTVDRPVTRGFLRKMEAGLWLDELKVKTRPCRVRQTGEKTFSIVLTQGLNRQIRRMCSKLGYAVEDLRRVRIMNIGLGDLEEGGYREISGEEYGCLLRMLDGEPRGPEHTEKPESPRGPRYTEKPERPRGPRYTEKPERPRAPRHTEKPKSPRGPKQNNGKR